jgi:hypothetical protein
VDSADALDERGLPGAIVAQQREHLAVVNRQVHIVQGEHGAEALGGARDRQRRRGRGAHERAA